MGTAPLDVDTLAWCAGVVDVLGTLRKRKMETGAVLPVLFVSTPRHDLTARLSELSGVAAINVHRNYERVGCGEHCTEPHQHVDSSTSRWSLTGARCTVFLSAVEPHMRLRREEASDLLVCGLAAPMKEATLTKMYDLGWPNLKKL